MIGKLLRAHWGARGGDLDNPPIMWDDLERQFREFLFQQLAVSVDLQIQALFVFLQLL